jgi:PAS domain S-box-containing protein
MRRELGERLPQSVLVDSLPDFLDDLVKGLRAPAPSGPPLASRQAAESASRHGEQRERSEVEVGQLVWEYGVLREVILDLVEERAVPVTFRELRVLMDLITTGIASSVRRFASEREAAARRAVELLALERGQLEAILASAPVGMSFVDRDLRYVRMNERLSQITGRTIGETLGRTLREILPTLADRLEPLYRQVFATGQPVLNVEIDGTLPTRAGEGHWLVSYFPVPDPASGEVALVGSAVVDITQRKEGEQRLVRARELDQQLLGIVSHDLRNPLNAILLGAGTLLARDDLPERHLRSVARIHAAAQRASRLIVDLLDLTRARLGDLPIRRREADLELVVDQVLEELRPSYPDRELRLEKHGWTGGFWDPDRLAQVAGNLVANALKYGTARSPVTVTLRGMGDEVTLSVHSEGEPIPPEILPSLFHPWARGVSGTDPAERSVGLGLFIVDRIVSAHGGRVVVESERGRGTTFTVTLPRQIQTSATPAPASG